MAKRKPGHFRGKGRSSFTMKPGTPMPQSMHPAIRKAEREITKLKEVSKTGRASIRKAAAQRQAAKKTGSAVVKYEPPKTAKPVAPKPSPAKIAAPKPPGAIRKFAGLHKQGASFAGRIGKSPVGRLLTGETGRRIIKGAAGKGLLRRAAARVVGTSLKFAGPVGAVYGAAVGARDIYKAGKRIHQRVIKPKLAERSLRKKSEEKYGTLEKAARTRKAMTGR